MSSAPAAALAGIVLISAGLVVGSSRAETPLDPGPGLLQSPAPGRCGPELWSGSWASEYGPIALLASGRTVAGSYGSEGGRITGRLDASGCTLIGTWTEAPTYAPPDDAGPLEFRLAPDATAWNGSWSYGNAAGWDSWDGWRISPQP